MKKGPAAIPYSTTNVTRFASENEVYQSANISVAERKVEIHRRLNL